MIMIKRAFCPECDASREVTVTERKETYPVRGEDITVTANVAVCTTCESDVWDNELDEGNINHAYDVYRQIHKVPTALDIKALRNKYGLSQRAFARLLGWGEATVARYEAGSLPDLGQSMVLRLIDDPKVFGRYLELNGNALTEEESERVHAALQMNAPYTAMDEQSKSRTWAVRESSESIRSADDNQSIR